MDICGLRYGQYTIPQINQPWGSSEFRKIEFKDEFLKMCLPKKARDKFYFLLRFGALKMGQVNSSIPNSIISKTEEKVIQSIDWGTEAMTVDPSVLTVIKDTPEEDKFDSKGKGKGLDESDLEIEEDDIESDSQSEDDCDEEECYVFDEDDYSADLALDDYHEEAEKKAGEYESVTSPIMGEDTD
jgi:hypothetical protein